MTDGRSSTARNLATLGIAVGGPVALFSGIGVGVTLIGGPPPFLVVIFTGAIGLVVAGLLVLAAGNARDTGHTRESGHGREE